MSTNDSPAGFSRSLRRVSLFLSKAQIVIALIHLPFVFSLAALFANAHDLAAGWGADGWDIAFAVPIVALAALGFYIATRSPRVGTLLTKIQQGWWVLLLVPLTLAFAVVATGYALAVHYLAGDPVAATLVVSLVSPVLGAAFFANAMALGTAGVRLFRWIWSDRIPVDK